MLQLKSIEPQHLTWLKNQRNRREIMDFCRQPYPLNEINQDDWLKECSRRHTMVPFIAWLGEERIGYAAFSKIDDIARHAEVSYFVIPEYANKGYGEQIVYLLLEYGFRRLNFQKVETDTFDFNKKEIEFNKRVGFKECGTNPRHYFKRGRFVDSISFYMFREDFEAMNKEKILKTVEAEAKPL